MSWPLPGTSRSASASGTCRHPRLRRVEEAESALRTALVEAGLHVRDLRVRDLGGTARVEVDPHLVAVVAGLAPALAAVRDCGYDCVEVDPRGFRSGSLNDALP